MPRKPHKNISLAEFLTVFKNESDRVCIRTFPTKEEKGIRLGKNYETNLSELSDTSSSIYPILQNENILNGVYFVVNNGGQRDDEITNYTACFNENDELTISKQHELLDNSPIKPSIRIETRKSVHAYWLLKNDCSTEEWKEIQIRLIDYFRGDPHIKNPSRVMRLPNFNHVSGVRTNYEYTPVRIVEFNPGLRFSAKQLLEAFPAARIIPELPINLTPTYSESSKWIEVLRKLLLSQPRKKTKDGYEVRCPVCGISPTGSAIVFNGGAIYCRKSGCEIKTMADVLGINTRKDKLNFNMKAINTYLRKPEPRLDNKALYGLAGKVVNTISSDSEAPPAALLAHLLTYFGNVIGFNPHFWTEGNKQGTNLSTVIVGESARGGRKGTTDGAIRFLFSQVANNMFWQEQNDDFVSSWFDRRIKDGGLCSGEGLVTALRDSNGDDDGENDKRLLVVEGEFSSVLRVKGREGNTLTGILRNAWDRTNLNFMRSQRSNTSQASNPHFSFIGHITEFELRDLFRNVDASNGFANRILWVFSKRTQRMPFGGQVWRENLQPLLPDLFNAVKFAKNVQEMRFNDES